MLRRQIHVSGLVQGVGFRPFIFRLATELHLTGAVGNTASGVLIQVQGASAAIESFLARLRSEAPPLARILSVAVEACGPIAEEEFRIVESRKGDAVHTLISPDMTVCGDCLREIFDPADRRYRYPFINCTNCGPRFTIVRGIPYDRPGTSMASFPMCPACQAEYDDPRSRRFHAQPNACWSCGPRLELWNHDGVLLGERDPVAHTIDLLRAGHIVAIKGLGGFHLAADALKDSAVALLRERKRRIEKPFAVMVPDVEAARELCEVSEAEREALQSPQRPIVLLRKRQICALPEAVAPRNRDLGVFLPYTPLHALLFREGGFRALLMTSGNASEEPIAIENHEARMRLASLADFFLVHNRDILLRCDDSVVRVAAGSVRQMRRSRGFVPVPIQLHREVPAILAVGAELKNTICLAQGGQAFLSQHIGDLETLAGCNFLPEAIDHLRKILEIDAKIVAHDLHPDYFSTRWAMQQAGCTLAGVQHHHAHIASCMAENYLDGPVIGIALDGAGYGTDGRIWGGEVLVAGYASFTRAAHLEYVPMPGGEAAIREPWRMAVSHLARALGPDFRQAVPALVEEIGTAKIDVVARMMERGVNAPLTSSCGRLFDAVASILGVRQRISYEGQAAIELEMVADDCAETEGYSFDLAEQEGCLVIGAGSMFRALLGDMQTGFPASMLSARFHNGLAQVLAQVARQVRERTGLRQVCLSGGTFQNIRLLQTLTALLRDGGLEVFTHSQVPAGDGGLSFGQALIAAHR